MSPTARTLWIIVPVLIDLVTKYVALAWLRPHDQIPLIGDLVLTLQFNTTGFGNQLVILGMGHANAITAISAAACLYAAAIYAIHRLVPKKWVRILLYVLISAIVNWGVSPLVELLPDFEMSPNVLAVVSKIGLLVLGGVVLAIARDRGYLALWSLLVAAGLGNGLSSVLPPFAGIDFLYSETVYRGTGMGVFNLADVMTIVFSLGIALYSLLRLLALTWQKRTPKTVETPNTPTPPES